MTDLEAQLAAMEERLQALEQRDDAEPRGLGRLWNDLFPPEVRTHMRAARKEQLLAARAFIDHWIDRVDREPAPTRRRRESISLE
jgi:hypothetical protein